MIFIRPSCLSDSCPFFPMKQFSVSLMTWPTLWPNDCGLTSRLSRVRSTLHRRRPSSSASDVSYSLSPPFHPLFPLAPLLHPPQPLLSFPPQLTTLESQHLGSPLRFSGFEVPSTTPFRPCVIPSCTFPPFGVPSRRCNQRLLPPFSPAEWSFQDLVQSSSPMVCPCLVPQPRF